ncbi:hypothetical protein IFM89_006424 [Coptis chinensis]|uniref:t-SNARE coiled-coil homology domain-containing protein n=1 Tax=Coptis chinensis TaxID=261450 RepID=A0A835HP34_9MAGN|nr:hypothetical protein IFM89_006424 [Coptis chinensis]
MTKYAPSFPSSFPVPKNSFYLKWRIRTKAEAAVDIAEKDWLLEQFRIIQMRIDPIHCDLDEEITGLHRQIGLLKNVAQEIESEAKFQNDLITQLQMTLIKAQAGVKNNMRRLNRSIIQQGQTMYCMLFCLLYFAFSWSTCWPNGLGDENLQAS